MGITIGFVLVAFSIGCGSPRQPPAPPPARPAPAIDAGSVSSVTSDGGASALVKPSGRRARIEAPHGGAIIALAVTADGNAAVTADELGGIRLWPKLDGSVEPRAVDLTKPQQLAIAGEPQDRFTIAMLDDVGGLVIQVVDRDGLAIQRASLGMDPGFAGIAMSPRGTIAWRTDQRVMRYADDGSVTAELAAEPGQRIAAIAITGERAVAVIEGGDATPWRRARWLAIADKLAWGGWIAAGDEVGSTIAVSASGKRLATLVGAPTRGITQTIVIDIATGKAVANEPSAGGQAVGFADDDHLAIGTAAGVTWLDLTKTKPIPKLIPNPEPIDRGLLAIGGTRAITAISGELVIATPAQTQFLGYGLQSPAVAATAPGGKLLIGLGDAFVLLDGQLQATAAPDLAVPTGSAIADMKWLAGDDWVVESSRIADGVTSVALVDVAQKKSVVVRTGMATAQMVLHDPTSQLVTLSLGEAPEVLKHVPGKLKLDRIATLPKSAGFERAELVPVNPKLAGGTQIVAVHMRDRLTLRWVRDARALDKGTAVTIDGSLAGVDPSGAVFVWQNDPQGMLELAVFREGKRVGTLPTDGPTAVFPDPRGGQAIQVGQRNIGLVGLDGTRRWAQSLQGVTEALWLDDGSIGIVSAAGIARLDPKTGEVIAARCGWRFGLSAKQHPVSPRFEPVCTQLR
ncbi:MAG: hypothetical protein ABI867_33605 [Kofleriaceae bacterium]